MSCDLLIMIYLPLFPLHRSWSSDGLMTLYDKETDTVECLISHFTSFSVLVSPSTHVPLVSELSVVSYIGCVLSIIFLTLTIFTLIIFRYT